MNARSIHFRLVAWYAGVLAVALAVSGLVVYLGMSRYLEGRTAAVQHQRAERVGAVVNQSAGSASLAEEINVPFAPEVTGRFLRVTAADGRMVFQSGPPVDKGFDPAQMPPPPLAAGTFHDHLGGGVEMVRVSKLIHAQDGADYWIESAESMAQPFAELHNLLVSLAIAVLAVAVVALVGGTVLVRRALGAVDAITGSAERITSRNLSERLPVPATGDEFEHLSRTLNRMIERLDEAFSHNRRFLADASHELRTPLTVLRGELEDLAQAPGIAPGYRERLGSTLEEAEHLATIVQGLFDLARLDAGEGSASRAPVDLGRLTSGTAEQMQLLAEDKGVRMQCTAPPGVWVEGDRTRLKQVVVNLLDNAIKYTPHGGTVAVTVSGHDGRAVLEVVDTGIGIPPESLPHVFERFYRVDKARGRDQGGAGLGLSIVKSICVAHRGAVEARSNGHDGTVLRVELPTCPAPPDGSAAIR